MSDAINRSSMRIIITGANSGVGQATAAALAGAGHHVTIACRTVAKGRLAAAEMTGEVDVRELDLADLASVRRFAASVDHVDVLVNNAGVLGLPLTRTVDGFEAHMGTNHLGHFALTCLLAPRVRNRIVVLTSGTYALARLHADDLNWHRRRYNKWSAYAESKLANVLFVQGLVRRGRRAYAVDPGFVKSGITRDMTGLLGWTNETISSKFAQNPEQGAQPTVRAATADLPNGACLAPRGPLRLWGTPKVGKLHARARDSKSAQDLWEVSVELTGCRWPGE
jgi:NAD(P)-dependent dehydrogenase (short-subunit alcohol dehydrogenase family)